MTVNALLEPVKLTATMSPLQKNLTLNDHFRKTAKGGIVSISWDIGFPRFSAVSFEQSLL